MAIPPKTEKQKIYLNNILELLNAPKTGNYHLDGVAITEGFEVVLENFDYSANRMWAFLIKFKESQATTTPKAWDVFSPASEFVGLPMHLLVKHIAVAVNLQTEKYIALRNNGVISYSNDY